VDIGRPYVDLETTKEYIIREFDESIDPIELLWHRDDENRLIESINSNNWLIQLENELPISMDKPIFIPRHTWHRVIKGHDKLLLKIYKS
jgi:hypothetical protein